MQGSKLTGSTGYDCLIGDKLGTELGGRDSLCM